MVVKTVASVGSNQSVGETNKMQQASAPATAVGPIQSAESQDVDDHVKDQHTSPKPSILQQLLHSMNPAQCLSPGVNTVIGRCQNPLSVHDDDDEQLDEATRLQNLQREVPQLLKDLEQQDGSKARTAALQKLYRLTDKDNQKNR